MARTKNYDAHISNLQTEIENTTKKLQTLKDQMASLLKEKEENDVSTLYKYIRANNISMKDIVKTFNSDEDINETPKNSEKRTSARSKNTTAQSRTRKNKSDKNTVNNSSKKNSRNNNTTSTATKSL